LGLEEIIPENQLTVVENQENHAYVEMLIPGLHMNNLLWLLWTEEQWLISEQKHFWKGLRPAVRKQKCRKQIQWSWIIQDWSFKWNSIP